MSLPSECVHSWLEVEVYCDDCGSHPGLRCEECDSLLDLIYEDDPRDA